MPRRNLIFPIGVDPPVQPRINRYQWDDDAIADNDAQIRALQNYALTAAPAPAFVPGGGVVVASLTLPMRSQWVPLNTSKITVPNGNGHWLEVTLPSPAVPPIQYAISDVGFSWDTRPPTINGGGPLIYCPDGPFQGQFKPSYSPTQKGGTVNFFLVPNDPTLGIYWMPVNNGIVAQSLGGVYTSAVTLSAASQWAPINTRNGTFPVTLSALAVPPSQIVLTDTGFAIDTKPAIINGGAFKIVDPRNPGAGPQSSIVFGGGPNTAGSTLVLNLVPNDPVLGIFWMPVG